MEVTWKQLDARSIVIEAHGDATNGDCDLLMHVLRRAIARATDQVVVDMRDVQPLDGATLSSLASLGPEATERDVALLIRAG